MRVDFILAERAEKRDRPYLSDPPDRALNAMTRNRVSEGNLATHDYFWGDIFVARLGFWLSKPRRGHAPSTLRRETGFLKAV